MKWDSLLCVALEMFVKFVGKQRPIPTYCMTPKCRSGNHEDGVLFGIANWYVNMIFVHYWRKFGFMFIKIGKKNAKKIWNMYYVSITRNLENRVMDQILKSAD